MLKKPEAQAEGACEAGELQLIRVFSATWRASKYFRVVLLSCVNSAGQLIQLHARSRTSPKRCANRIVGGAVLSYGELLIPESPRPLATGR